jgi:hypothetical protein
MLLIYASSVYIYRHVRKILYALDRSCSIVLKIFWYGEVGAEVEAAGAASDYSI